MQVELPPELEELAGRAEALAHEPALTAAFDEAMGDPVLWTMAETDPSRFLEAYGLTLPEGLSVTFGRHPGIRRPAPDHALFTVRLTRCHTYWLPEPDGAGYGEVELCWGFEISPHPVPAIA